jgi:recombinational DNA repair protein RecT
MTDTREREDLAEVELADPSTAGKQIARPLGEREAKLTAARDNMLADVFANKGDIAQFLSLYGESYERFEGGLKMFLMRQMQTQPDFFERVTAISFTEALLRCAKDGLIPDGKEAAIAAYKDKSGRGAATYMPMRDGFVKVLWRTGLIRSINDQVVTADEEKSGRFEYEEGDRGFIRHRPSMLRKDTDPIVAAYCVVELVGGGLLREVVMQADLGKIAAMSRSPARQAWAHQMHRKAAIRRIMGKMPREKAIVQLLEHDEMNYDLAAPALTERAPSGLAARLTGPSARPGFAAGHVEAQTNPLSSEALDERLAVDSPAEPAGSPLAADRVQTRKGAAEAREAASAAPAAGDGASERVRGFLSGEEPGAVDADLEQRIADYIAAMDAAATPIKLKTVRARAHQLLAELADNAPERAEALAGYFDRRHSELELGAPR